MNKRRIGRLGMIMLATVMLGYSTLFPDHCPSYNS